MDSDELKHWMNTMFPKTVKYDVIPADYLLTKKLEFPMFLAVNCCRHDKIGKHWVGIVVRRRHSPIYFFDSFGRGYNSYGVYFTRFKERIRTQNVVEKRVQVQNYGTDSCGKFVLYFLCKMYCGNFSDVYKKLSSTNLSKNEVLIRQYFINQKHFVNNCCPLRK